MDKQQLYETIAARKITEKHFLPYQGDNGRVNRCVDLFKKGVLKSGGTLLDVGGAVGDLGYATREMFERRIIVDISARNLDAAAAKGNETLLRDVDKQGFLGIGDEEIDSITALDFIEHVIDPEYFARECHRVLKRGGQVFINTPNIQFFWNLQELVVNGNFPHTSGDKDVFHGGHLAFFTYNDLCQIFGSAGFAAYEQIRDVENFRQPTDLWIKLLNPRSQAEYVVVCERLGNPNLLFKCVK